MAMYDVIRYTHIFAGTVALASFWTAAVLRKGGGSHRTVGRTFLVSMAVVALTGVFIALAAFRQGRPVFASFLLYLVVIVATPTWLGWRALREKQDVKRYTGPLYHVLAWVNIASGAAMLALGIVYRDPLFGGLSAVALVIGPLMLRFARQDKPARLWWLQRHYLFMLAAGVGTHVAFLNIGLSHVLPADLGPTALRVSFFLPFVPFLIARVWLDRKYGPRSPQKLTRTPTLNERPSTS
jgi:hypothetical protein